MRALLNSPVILLTILICLQTPTNVGSALAKCACLKHAADEARREQAQKALQHLPSESSFLTARMFVSEKLSGDAADSYVKAVDLIENELARAKVGQLAEAVPLPSDAIAYLTERAVDMEIEAANFLLNTQGQKEKAADFKAMAFQHMLESEDLSSNEKCRMAKQLAGEYEQLGDTVKASRYANLLTDELKRTRGRYSPEVRAALARAKRYDQSSSSSQFVH